MVLVEISFVGLPRVALVSKLNLAKNIVKFNFNLFVFQYKLWDSFSVAFNMWLWDLDNLQLKSGTELENFTCQVMIQNSLRLFIWTERRFKARLFSQNRFELGCLYVDSFLLLFFFCLKIFYNVQQVTGKHELVLKCSSESFLGSPAEWNYLGGGEPVFLVANKSLVYKMNRLHKL